jgi:hypothetical protein
MSKPKFRLENYSAHCELGKRLFLQPINSAAWNMIRNRDNGLIPDFTVIIYLNKH